MQALNDIVTQQSREISRLNLHIEQIKVQLQSLKTESASDTDSASRNEFEIPPHY
jgi:uncharacterized coiled-coil protein SlyX